MLSAEQVDPDGTAGPGWPPQ